MTTLSLPFAAVAPVAAPVAPAAPCFTRDEVKARAKAIKKWRKHESRRYFFSWCACLHALGFSF
ncbi:hypothetical protein J4D99_07635 [Siccationidurans ginsengisoli]|uniref:hypothetical protein n=1 Tax=Hymenobacter TaxID=89966 RepID=UPI001AACD7C4|nr:MULTISPECIES: hypothetical protein [unclassified Hymenobacter]MBO2031256.1 hypothetical protein [Hymenobacter sp. BT559]